MTDYDFAIIGGGIVGTSTAWQLQQRYPNKRIVLLEKESAVSRHQTGHNSGVIHAGVYYAPGSLKARFCREGAQATKAFCQQYDIPFDVCGKLLVATTDLEMQRMHDLFQRCQDNALNVTLLDRKALHQREPNIAGKGAIWVADTGIVDYSAVTRQMAACFEALGGEVRLQSMVQGIDESPTAITIGLAEESIRAKQLIVCAGLMADRLAQLQGLDIDFRIIPFRGEYYRLPSAQHQLINHLIYPIPDPELPFLGIHLTRMIDGSITVGPNALQGWKKEGYGRVNISLKESVAMMRFSGFWRLLTRYWRFGLTEMSNAYWKPNYLKQVNKYCPSLTLDDLTPYPAGIRAQAVKRDGSLVHDFLFAESPRSLHVCNAPSPAATAAIPIGAYICDKIEQKKPSGLLV